MVLPVPQKLLIFSELVPDSDELTLRCLKRTGHAFRIMICWGREVSSPLNLGVEQRVRLSQLGTFWG